MVKEKLNGLKDGSATRREVKEVQRQAMCLRRALCREKGKAQ